MGWGPSLDRLAADLHGGRVSSRDLVEDCLARIDDKRGEGERVFLKVDHDGARAAADAMDGLRRAGAEPSPYAGIPISVKDLFDVRGQVTRAGSRVLADAPPAQADAPTVARLRAAGFIVIGRTNMTEFAFSGLGINPHYGTPINPWRRAQKRIPGGSSSGAAVSVADGMAHGALGTDTGGSCRIPAALTGLAGFKPTAARVPTAGALPLSATLDSVGPLARTVRCCAILNGVLAGASMRSVPIDLSRLRIGLVANYVTDDVEPAVAAAMDRLVARLSELGVSIVDVTIPELDRIPTINAKGGFAAPEAYHRHRAWIAERAGDYDPRVLSRILRGREQDAADYLDLLDARRAMIDAFAARSAPFDALLSPTVPVLAPPIADLEDQAAYGRMNALMLRNPSVVNLVDGCAVSLPIGDEEGPVGASLWGANGDDARILAIGDSIEQALAGASRLTSAALGATLTV